MFVAKREYCDVVCLSPTSQIGSRMMLWFNAVEKCVASLGGDRHEGWGYALRTQKLRASEQTKPDSVKTRLSSLFPFILHFDRRTKDIIENHKHYYILIRNS